MSKVDDVAQAMRAFLLGPNGPTYSRTTDALSPFCCVDGDIDLPRLAVAALVAMRSPTDEMVLAMSSDGYVVEAGDLKEAWDRAIDAAIAENQE